MLGYMEAAAAEGSNLVVFPEMALTGYDDEEDKAKPEKCRAGLRRPYQALHPRL